MSENYTNDGSGRQNGTRRPAGSNGMPVGSARRPQTPADAAGTYRRAPAARRPAGTNPAARPGTGAAQPTAKPPVRQVNPQQSAPSPAPAETANGSGGSGRRYKTPQPKKRKKEHRFWRTIGIIIAGTILLGIFTVGIGGMYALKHITDFVNGDVAIDLVEYKAGQSQTTILYMIDNDGQEIEMARLHGEENRLWVSLEDIPKNMQNAFIALEDKRFREHNGVDWIRTIAVVSEYNFSQGGSTITQQLIKNLTGENGRTFKRKYNEILNALNLEKHFSKDTILEAYLNTLYLDGGCYGVETAAEYYFGKEVGDLNLAECACIAAITQEPSTYDPLINPEENRERQMYCLSLMLEQGLVTQEAYDEAVNYKMIFTNSPEYEPEEVEEDEEEEYHDGYDGMDNVDEDDEEKEVQSYYIDYVIESVIKDLMETRNYSYSEAWRLVYYGGLRIHIAEDLEIQKELEQVYYNREGFPDMYNDQGEQIQSCMVIMDYTGRVMGLVGQAGPKQSDRCLNIATDSRRQPGSAIKPLSVYSLAIETGDYYWSSRIQNYGVEGIDPDGPWPYNYGGDPGSPYSYETIQQALAPSHNTVPVQLLKKIGVDKSYNWLKDAFSFTSLEPQDENYAPLGVGAMTEGVYAIEMCAAYTTFGNSGVYHSPYCYYTVTNFDGSKVYLTHNDEGQQVMAPGTADVMNKLLQTVVTDYANDGTAIGYAIDDFEMFAKTGTTTDEKDRWFIGGSPYYVCTVWMGYAEHPAPLNFYTNYCGELYKRVMNDIHRGLPEKTFTYSDELVSQYFCTGSGDLDNGSCYSDLGWFRKDALPPYCDGSHSVKGATYGGYSNYNWYSDSDDSDDTETTTAAPETTAAPPAEDPQETPGDDPGGGEGEGGEN